MNTKSPVDVLAVMDDVRLAASEHHLWTAKDQAEYVAARAAVAELVAAATTVERQATRHDGDDRMFDRLHAALAKFG